ncbi:hypothetical protein F4825DRAFT_477030 [Nemania diffusa]|nr:hypothetical protein F4825DRAFT_477030 [Nemania diffusa]
MAWLSPAGHADHLDRVARSRTAGTGNWLLRDPDFQAWESGAARPATLWIRGGPGVGKTVLAGNIIEYLQERHTHPEGVVGFYFCDQLRGNQDDDVAVFGSLIAQICVQLENLPSQLVQAFENAQRYERYQITTSDAPANLLKSLVAELTSYFLVIDALDELKQGFTILDFINEFSSNLLNVHYILFSRDKLNLRNALAHCATVSLNSERTIADIETFVLNTAQKLPVDDSVLKENVIQKVLDRSGGVFLWTRLVMNTLSHAVSPAHLLNLIEEVPESISAIYRKHLVCLLQKDLYAQDLAIRVLRWVGCAKRPLSWAELQCAVSRCMALEEGDVSYHMPFWKSVVELLYPLVIYDYERDEFCFQHLSVRDFLIQLANPCLSPEGVGKFFIDEHEAAEELASACLAHLMSDRVHDPLALYANRFWCEHALEAPYSMELLQKIYKFLSDNMRRQVWLSSTLRTDRPGFLLQTIIQQQNKLRS